MNILKDIKIRGDVFSEYAFLSYTLSFESSESVSAKYTFSLPKGSLISSVKLFFNGRITETKIASASHTAMLMQNEVALATLRRVKDNEYIFTIDNIDKNGIILMLSVYAPLSENRLSIPLSKKGSGTGEATHTADIQLNALNAESISSPTHEITISEKNQVSTGVISAGKDFSLALTYGKKESSGIVQKTISGGEALIKIYPEASLSFDKKLLFIYDGISSKTSSVMARDFIFHSAKNCGMPFAVSGEADGFKPPTDEALSALLESLSHIETKATTICDVPDDTIALLLTEEPEKYKDYSIENLYTVTFGASAMAGYHIYPGENVALRAENIIKDILFKLKLERYSITSPQDATIVGISDGITVYLKYSGAFPEGLILSNGEKAEKYPLKNIKVYDSFAPIGLVCAKIKQKLLYQKLYACSPDQISSIRKELEEIGLKFSSLNSETALIATLDKKVAPIRVIIPNDADQFTESTISMFRETTRLADREFLSRSIDYIIKHIRGDGAICTDGETSYFIRQKLSKICLAALILADKNDYTKKTEEFLSFSFSGKAQAREYLLSIFKEDFVIPKELPLDLLTASKIILSI